MKIYLISLLFFVFIFSNAAFGQAKIKKGNLSKGEKEALKDFKNREKDGKGGGDKKDRSFLGIKSKKNKKQPTGLKRSMGVQDKAVKKRMKKNLRRANKGKWRK